MSDVVIFAVGSVVMGVVFASAFIALIASDYPNEPDPQAAPTLMNSGSTNRLPNHG